MARHYSYYYYYEEKRWLKGSAPDWLQISGPGFESTFSPAHGKLYQSWGGKAPGMTQYRVLASEGRQRYSVYTKTPKNIWEIKIIITIVVYINYNLNRTGSSYLAVYKSMQR